MIKVTLYTSLIVASFFSILSLIFYFGDWYRLIYIFVMSLFVGLVLAPEIEPKAFRNPWLFQILGGAIFGIILAIFMGFEMNGIIALAGIFAFLGFTASSWLKYFHGF